jgi:DNA-binding NtrC family response regulator
MENATPVRTSRILIVDDEQSILNAVRRELSTPPLGRHRYEIEMFTNPIEALERAKVQEFEVVLSDYRMPEMDGLEFLKALARIQPDCARVVLSGQTDFDALIRMINETHIYRFIAKPWSSYFLKSTVSQAVEFRQAQVENRRLAKILREHGIDVPLGALNPVDQILVVDHDINAANSIARCLTQKSRLDDIFRAVQEDAHGHAADLNAANISVQISDSALHAMKMADQIEFSCVIADFEMPGMDGAQFLAHFAEKQPECAAILMSGENNLEGVVVALDLAHIHAFISKPWVDFELRTALALALTRRRVLLENKVLADMCKARDLGGID